MRKSIFKKIKQIPVEFKTDTSKKTFITENFYNRKEFAKWATSNIYTSGKNADNSRKGINITAIASNTIVAALAVIKTALTANDEDKQYNGLLYAQLAVAVSALIITGVCNSLITSYSGDVKSLEDLILYMETKINDDWTSPNATLGEKPAHPTTTSAPVSSTSAPASRV